MKIKIQNTNEAFRVQERSTLKEFLKNSLGKESNAGAIVAAEMFLETFPRFK